MQINLTKTRPRHVWVGLDNDDDTIGIWKPVEYENIRAYCEYYRHKGYDIDECRSEMRDEVHIQRMEKEKEKKDNNKEQQNNKGKVNFHARTKKNEEKRNQNNNDKKKQKET